MEKKLSCAVIVRDPVTRFVVGAHPTGHPRSVLDLPKGGLDEGERPIECACRELQEETGLAYDPSELRDLGRYPYTKGKDLHVFYVEKEVDVKSLECTSMFEREDTHEILPEMNWFTKVSPDSDKWYPALRRVILQALQENDLVD